MKSTQKPDLKVIGLTGQPLAGKDTAADFLVSKGFAHISLGNLLREEMAKQGIPLDRAHTGPFAAEAKRTRGMAYLAELAADKATGNTAISGIRGRAEVEMLRQRFGADFALLVIDAPIEMRYERAQKRGREGDHIPFEEFQRIENKERNDPSGAQEVDRVIALADQTLDNSGTIEELHSKLEAFL